MSIEEQPKFTLTNGRVISALAIPEFPFWIISEEEERAIMNDYFERNPSIDAIGPVALLDYAIDILKGVAVVSRATYPLWKKS